MRRYAWLIVLLLAPPAVLPDAAYGDWQYTRWGMSVDQVKQASHGAAGPLQASDSQYIDPGTNPKLAANYATGEFMFRVLFAFDTAGKLNFIHLDLQSGKVEALLGELKGKYGAPLEVSHGRFLETLNWQDKSNRITYNGVGDKTATIDYRPRSTASNKGL